ncbi:restriction endonuclease subunit S [Parasphingorhabdus sp.]|uniref:restriction endonuclease subunit S n=1 Tax=Parasphingorhabdus sp. TaxID=2709688 RepID=UPI0032EE3CD8
MSINADGQAESRVPVLRFPDFSGQPLYDIRLCDVTEEPSIRNHGQLPAELVMGVRKDEGIVPMQEQLVAADISRYKVVKNDWFAYNPMRLNIGSIARWQGKKDVLVSPDYVVFRCLDSAKPTGILPSFLDHFRRTKQWDSFVNGSGDGGVRVRTYYRDLARMKLLLPNILEQQKIADGLSSIDAVISAEAAKLEALEDHKSGLLQQLFPAPGETVPSLRLPDFQGAADWEEKAVGDVFSVTRGNVLAMTLVDEKPSSEKPFPVYSSQTKNAGLAGYYSDYLYEDSITWTTDGANAGDVNYRSDKFYCTNVCGVLLSNEGFANPFVAAIINSVAKNHVSYVGNPKLMNGVMAKIVVPLPSVEEQLQLASVLASVDAVIGAQMDKLAALEVYKKGFLQQLFPSQESFQA